MRFVMLPDKKSIGFLLIGFVCPFLSIGQSENSRQVDTLKTLMRAAAYSRALDCQMDLVDSLRDVYQDQLKGYHAEVWSGLTDQQKGTVLRLYKESVLKQNIKRDQFLEFEETTRDIDPGIYDYMEYGFELMTEFPSSKYFNLLGADNSELNFLDTFDFNAYFNLYEEFELALTRGLARENCRAHLAIPFYHEEENELIDRRHRRRNALFYLAMNTEPLVGSGDGIIDSANVARSSFDQIQFTDSPYTIDDFVDIEKVNEMRLSMTPGFISPNSYELMKVTDDKKILMGTLIHAKSSIDKSELIREFMSGPGNKDLKEKMVGSGRLYFDLETEENRHDLSRMMSISGIYVMGDELFMVILVESGTKEGSIDEFLSIVKHPAEK